MSLSGDPVLETYYQEAVVRVVEEFGLECVRVDHEVFDGTITSRIRHNIDRARVIIVDTTQDRPNCYFEAGYAVAKNKNVIWQRLNAGPYADGIQFDVKDYPHILYTTAENLRARLRAKLAFYLKQSR
jgi:enoyl reductase-like protein